MRGIFRLLQRKELKLLTSFKKTLELEPKLKAEIDGIIEELKSHLVLEKHPGK
jgi:hypothetical protein